MSKQLLVLKDFVSSSLSFGVFFPKKKNRKSDNVQIDEEIDPKTGEKIEKKEPPLLERYFADDLLVPASSEETKLFYERLKQNEAVPDNCYWFYVQGVVVDNTILTKPEHIPIYHFGLKFGVGMFFSGRKGFDWSKNGGTVYKILPY